MSSKKDITSLSARRKPRQERAQKRYNQILDITAELLDEVGFDDLTTILIAKRLEISVGSLYHYFPNKHAVLWALASRWLAEVTLALDEMDEALSDDMGLTKFTDMTVDRMLVVYRRQQGILPLVQAIYAVPELRALDIEHDNLVINRMADMYERVGIVGGRPELERLARVYLEMVHALSLTIVLQKAAKANRTLKDLKMMIEILLSNHH